MVSKTVQVVSIIRNAAERNLVSCVFHNPLDSIVQTNTVHVIHIQNFVTANRSVSTLSKEDLSVCKSAKRIRNLVMNVKETYVELWWDHPEHIQLGDSQGASIYLSLLFLLLIFQLRSST